MKSTWFPILMIFALLGLLGLLATLQYQWLGQISDAEQIRLEGRLRDDTRRFSEDFNNEIQNAFFLFQVTEEDWNSFGKRYKLWQTKTNYRNLITDFFYIKNSDTDEIKVFNRKNGVFEKTKWNQDFAEINTNLKANFNTVKFNQDGYKLIIPIQKSHISLKEVIGIEKKLISVKDKKGNIIQENIIGPEFPTANKVNMLKGLIPEPVGFLVIDLDEAVIKNELLPDLQKKYFSETDAGSFKLSVTGENGTDIFQTHQEPIEQSDAQTRLFNLNHQNIFFMGQGEDLPFGLNEEGGKVIFSNSITSTSINKPNVSTEDFDQTIDVSLINGTKPKVRVWETTMHENKGLWLLKVQHIDGSLEQFITNTRRRNLAISFGILSLLAVSIILIFLSSQRVKSLAQKQMDFVSSVSHEFRTPLAVIYSASENLSDGVIDDRERITDYGTLIKREGKKLSGMVEQILEFAGANSGKRKYDFKDVSVKTIIEQALEECQPFIKEKEFEVEKDFATSLPIISADKNALTLAVQNLINNSLKYSNGSRWLKVSANNHGETLKISVEDRGIGISAKDKKQIFEPFFRAENVVDEQISGNGLGLSLVKQIIQAHNGTIKLESEIGRGSKFTIEIPVNE